MRLLWWRFRDHGRRRWSVYLVDELKDEDTGQSLLGQTDWDKRRVYIVITQTTRMMARTVMHELVHVACGAKARADIMMVAEELIAERVEVGLWHVMTGLGMRLPPFPPGFKPRSARRPRG